MTDPRLTALQDVLEQGIGAGVDVQPESAGLRSGLRSHFSGLTANQGPVFSIAPTGLRRHRVALRFGTFSTPLVQQMQGASEERLALARALVQQLARRPETTVVISAEQSLEDWSVTGPDFVIEVMLRNVDSPSSEEAVIRTAREVMVPLMAAMAELIGYDEAEPDEYDVEGRVTVGTVTRRERSPRNRLLCLSIHGHRCIACGLAPSDIYGEAGSIIEVHHLEPVSLLSEPRPYDPRTDLVPLCPNCHRAVHTRRPVPYTPDQLKEMLRHGSA